MSFMASRGAALLAPLPGELQAPAAADAASLAMPAAPAAAGATAVAATVAATPPGAGAHAAPQADAMPAAAAPVADAATQPDASAPTAATTPVSGGKTAVVAQIGKPDAMPQAAATAGSMGSAVLALAMVIGLILALAWLARRLPGVRGGSANAALRVVGSLALGPRERLVVVAVGDTQLVLGVGAGGTRTLHTLSEPLPVAEATGTPAFAQLLAQHFGKKA